MLVCQCLCLRVCDCLCISVSVCVVVCLCGVFDVFYVCVYVLHVCVWVGGCGRWAHAVGCVGGGRRGCCLCRVSVRVCTRECASVHVYLCECECGFVRGLLGIYPRV